ncbi:FadR/GntR family transcriptional regulator [Dietzia psychralcaliphila]|uniref:FadR/GntR family transcriptional regulator n=1 Tax=Dietzia psychralcaliphila TaxID=139021 RepID=UPI001C1E3539|nr:FadR/GntR family transcriptional regulator [Dietzia psychralcaliphila]
MTSNSPLPVGRLVRAPKTAELIAADLRRQIVKGELQTGVILPPEAELMGQYGVSRPTLREAFRILETENLITVRRGSRGGAQVTAPDSSVAARHVGLLLQMRHTTLVDVYEARKVIEPRCAYLLARHRTPDDLVDLRQCIVDLGAAIGTGIEAVPDTESWAELTYRFHVLIFQRCGNQTLSVQCEMLADIVATHLHQTIVHGFSPDKAPAEQFRLTLRSYEKMVSLLEAMDADAAETHWRTHMEVAGRSMFADLPRDQPVVDLFS